MPVTQEQLNAMKGAAQKAAAESPSNTSSQQAAARFSSGSSAQIQPVGQVTPKTTQSQNSSQSALDIINKSSLDEGTKMLFSQVVQGWNPDTEVNVGSVLAAFNKIKSSTIDPYFAELSNAYINQAKQSYAYAKDARALQLEQEKTTAAENLRGTRANLEASGMTFTGEGLHQLGKEGAYKYGKAAEAGGKIPIQFGGPEGLVPQGNRLMASSSQAQYQQGLNQIAQNVESQLGSKAAGGLVPGAKLLGGIDKTAQLPFAKSQAEASTLSGLYTQAQQNTQAQQPIRPFTP